MSEETEIKFIKINRARDYIDVMYNDVKPIEKGYQVHLQYDGYDIKRVIEYFYKIEQENQQLKEELQKADSITQSCIFDGKEESEINFRKAINLIEEYKSVLDEIREIINQNMSSYSSCIKAFDEIEEILDKVKDGE